MTKFSSTSSFILLIVTLLLITSNASIVEQTCKAIKQRHWEASYDYCLQILNNDTKSQTADTSGLAFIAANRTKASVERNIFIITDLLKSLNFCLGQYSTMNMKLLESMDSMKSGKMKEAENTLYKGEGVPLGCDIQLFEAPAMKDPLSTENMEAMHLVHLAIMITNLSNS